LAKRKDSTIALEQLDDEAWMNATGTSSWEFSLDTSKMRNGAHSLAARAFDGTDYSDPVARTFSVENQKAAGKGFIPGFGGLGTTLAAVLILGWIVRKKRDW
jgi:hypothetical protein